MGKPWTNPFTASRCEGKRGWRNADKADAKAAEASLRTGELIISYECPDCGFWHIGHADETQKRLRESTSGHRQCKHCKIEMPPERRADYCSPRCRKNAGKLRQRGRKKNGDSSGQHIGQG